MCGRYHLSQPERFAKLHGLTLIEQIKIRYNVAPTQTVAAVLNESPTELRGIRWGMIPFWARDPKIGSTLINARAGKVASTPAYRDAFKHRHCLIPADGFYEWQKLGPKLKQPFHILMKDEAPFAFAGLWERWKDPAQPVDSDPVKSCTIITTTSNDVVSPIHDRMPVILPREKYEAWLSSDITREERQLMLVPYPAEQMKSYPIGQRVVSPRNDDAEILNAVPINSA